MTTETMDFLPAPKKNHRTNESFGRDVIFLKESDVSESFIIHNWLDWIQVDALSRTIHRKRDGDRQSLRPIVVDLQ